MSHSYCDSFNWGILFSDSIIVFGILYVPADTSTIISKLCEASHNFDAIAEEYADNHNIPKRIIKSEYDKYGKSAPLKRNETIAELSDLIITIWECVKLELAKINYFYYPVKC